MSQMVKSDETIEVPGVGGRKARVLSRKLLAEIIEPRVEEIFSLIQREVVKSGRTIGAGDILTTGSYTKCPFVDDRGEVVGEIEGLGKLAFTLS